WMSSLWLAVVVGCVYALSAKMSLALLTPEGVAEFWPAAGVAAGTLIALGRDARWGGAAGAIVAAILANLMGDRNLLSSVVFRRQLAPSASDVNATIWGPPVTLTASATQALAMVLHELVTNAAKYGALSTAHGRVEANWHRGPHNDTANLSIVWREIGGPTVAASPDCGYGVRIIRELIPREFGGSVDLAFASDGVCCKIDIPIESIPSNAVSRPDGEIATMLLARADEVIE